MGFIIDLLMLPFTIIGESIECLTSCLILLVLASCCGGTIAVLYALDIITF